MSSVILTIVHTHQDRSYWKGPIIHEKSIVKIREETETGRETQNETMSQKYSTVLLESSYHFVKPEKCDFLPFA